MSHGCQVRGIVFSTPGLPVTGCRYHSSSSMPEKLNSRIPQTHIVDDSTPRPSVNFLESIARKSIGGAMGGVFGTILGAFTGFAVGGSMGFIILTSLTGAPIMSFFTGSAAGILFGGVSGGFYGMIVGSSFSLIDGNSKGDSTKAIGKLSEKAGIAASKLGYVSIDDLRQQFTIDYREAANIMHELHSAGLLSESDKTGRRKVIQPNIELMTSQSAQKDEMGSCKDAQPESKPTALQSLTAHKDATEGNTLTEPSNKSITFQALEDGNPVKKVQAHQSFESIRFGDKFLQRVPLEPMLDRMLNKLPFRGRVLFFVVGVLIGSSNLFIVLLNWYQASTQEPEEERHELPSIEDPVIFSGIVSRWVQYKQFWSKSHWERIHAEVRPGLLLLSPVQYAESIATEPTGCAQAFRLKHAQVKHTPDGITLTLSSGERELLQPALTDKRSFSDAMKGGSSLPQKRIFIDFPSSWAHPCHAFRIVELSSDSFEYQRVAKMAERQQYNPGRGGSNAFVKGKLHVVGVARVQSPQIWEQYSLRRAIIASENDGDPNEKLLWHGTSNVNVILKDGFDPRVSNMNGMFGAGTYFADKTTKSVRYCGNKQRGQLLLCRVSLGRPYVTGVAQSHLRRPPEPLPIWSDHFSPWWKKQKFHSVWGSSDALLSTLLMNEFIVYHTNQGYPEYVVDFVMK